MVHLSFTLSVTEIYHLRFCTEKTEGESVLAVGTHSLVHTYEDDASTTSVLDGTMHWLTKYIRKQEVCAMHKVKYTTYMATLFNIEYHICPIRCCGYYLFRPSILCGFYSRAATIQERHLFSSANPFADVQYRRVRNSIGWLLDRQETYYWLLLIGLLRCFGAASLVHN